MLSDPLFRELCTLPINFKTAKGLAKNGYIYVSEILNFSPEKLSNTCDISLEQAQKDLKIIYDYQYKIKPNYQSAKDMFSKEFTMKNQKPKRLTTICKGIDDILEGGLVPGKITEICGEPGVGKTQMSFQLSLAVQLPSWCQCLDGDTLYIDTEGNFVPKRIKQMAASLVDHYKNILAPAYTKYLASQGIGLDQIKEIIKEYTVEKFLDRILYCRVSEPLELIKLSEEIKSNPPRANKLKLIIVDSIAMPFRYQSDNFYLRNRQLATVAQNFLEIAQRLSAVIVFTNQITTKFNENDTNSLIPALGPSWGHICSIRLQLSVSSDRKRRMKIIKHPGLENKEASYIVNSDGIRDFVLC